MGTMYCHDTSPRWELSAVNRPELIHTCGLALAHHLPAHPPIRIGWHARQAQCSPTPSLIDHWATIGRFAEHSEFSYDFIEEFLHAKTDVKGDASEYTF